MSDHSYHPPEPERLTHNLGFISKVALVIGIAGLGLSAIGYGCCPVQLAHSLLFAFIYFFTISAGSFFWVILHHAIDANWTVLVRRQFENLSRLMVPLLFVYLVILCVFRLDLWHWMRPGMLESDPILREKQPYLAMPFFTVRWVFFFAYFIGAGWFFRRLSVAQDTDGSVVHSWRLRWWAPLAIVGFGLSITFSAIDWLMALDYHWYSTMWGVYIFAGSAQSSMALCIVVIFLLRRLGYLKPVNSEHSHIMGKLLFAFTVFWAYIAFSQYMLYWYANIPEETVFFIKRNVGTWTYLSIFLVAGHFVFPFIYLLTQAVKKSFASLSIIALWILFMHGVDMFWIIMPVVRPEGIKLVWTDFTCWVGLAGIMIFWFIRVLGSAGMFPSRDPHLEECVKLTN